MKNIKIIQHGYIDNSGNLVITSSEVIYPDTPNPNVAKLIEEKLATINLVPIRKKQYTGFKRKGDKRYSFIFRTGHHHYSISFPGYISGITDEDQDNLFPYLSRSNYQKEDWEKMMVQIDRMISQYQD